MCKQTPCEGWAYLKCPEKWVLGYSEAKADTKSGVASSWIQGLSAVCGFCSLLRLDSDIEKSNKAAEVINVHFVA